jgi:peptide/nickel transport system permease protein
MTAAADQVASPARGRERRELRHDPLLLLSGSLCVVLVLVASFGSALAPHSPTDVDILAAGQGPSAEHLLGTDSLGRDVFSRLLVGARLSFLGPAFIVVVSATVGTALALASAWFSGLFDSAVKRVLNVMFAVPAILIAVLASAVFGLGFWAPVLALSMAYVPYIARVVRSVAVRECHQPYVESLQLAGFSGWQICMRHLLPNVMPVVIALSTIGFGSALVDFGATSFLGLGVQPPQAEWGLMVGEGRSELLNDQIQQSLAAGLAIVISVVSFNVLGERIARRMGVRT